MKKVVLILCAMLVSMFIIPTGVLAEETKISIDYPITDGVDASFSFNMSYNPKNITVFGGEFVNLSFAPAPNTVDVKVNITALLESHGYSIPTFPVDFTGLIPESISLPIARTPLGSETVYSYVIPVATGMAITIDSDINGDIVANLSADGGSLSENTLTWNEWGGREATLDTQTEENITVTTEFSYIVSMSFTVNFTAPLIDIGYDIASVPLGQLSFPEILTQTIYTLKTYEEGYDDGHADGVIDGYADGFVAGNTSGYAGGYEIGTIDGYADGFADGNCSGYDSGYENGTGDGYADGYDLGHADGYTEGYNIGYYSAQNETAEATDTPALGVIATITTILIIALVIRTKKYARE